MKLIILCLGLFLLTSCAVDFQRELIRETTKKGLLLVIQPQDKIVECVNNEKLVVSSQAINRISHTIGTKGIAERQVIYNELANCNKLKK
jgi:hypothetical protein